MRSLKSWLQSGDGRKILGGLAAWIVFITLYYIVLNMKGTGQLLAFTLQKVLLTGGIGVFMFGFALFFLYLIIKVFTNKNAEKRFLAALLCTFLFISFGSAGTFFIGKESGPALLDVAGYFAGNVVEETVIIEKFDWYPGTSSNFFEYTFDDGREFSEPFELKVAGGKRDGARYQIRYLPRTKKLLTVERIEEENK